MRISDWSSDVCSSDLVTGKALALGLKPIVVVNKIDRSDARAAEVLDEVFELFLTLEANDEQLDFPILYASGRGGYASESPEAREGKPEPLFKTIVSHVPTTSMPEDGPFPFLGWEARRGGDEGVSESRNWG